MTDAMGTTMIRSEEQLAVGSERVVVEEVRMHKYVTSEIINVPITLRKEHISIERVRLHDKDRRHSVSGHSATGSSHTGHHGHASTTGHHSTTGHSTTGVSSTGVNTNSDLNRSGVVAPTGTVANTTATTTTTNTNTGLVGAPTTGLHGQSTVAGTNVTGTAANANMTGAGLHGSSLSQTNNSALNSDVSGEWDFILSSEQPVITTRVVPYERVRVRKITDHSIQLISADLRKENIDFTLQPNIANQGQPEVAIRDVNPAQHHAGRGEVVECMDGNGMVNQAGSGAQVAQAGGLYNKDNSALQTGNATNTYDKTTTQQQSTLTNQQRASNDGRPLERV